MEGRDGQPRVAEMSNVKLCSHPLLGFNSFFITVDHLTYTGPQIHGCGREREREDSVNERWRYAELKDRGV